MEDNVGKLDKILKNHSNIWKTKSAFMSWLRGGVRGGLWKRHPVKIEFIKQNRQRIPNPNPKGKVATVWGGVCALTGETHVLNNLEVDHKKGNHSLKDINDIQSFMEGIVLIDFNDLQFVSKEAHKIKSYAEKHNISFEEAKKKKRFIEVCKSPELLLDTLKQYGVESIPTTAIGKKRLLEELMFAEGG